MHFLYQHNSHATQYHFAVLNLEQYNYVQTVQSVFIMNI